MIKLEKYKLFSVNTISFPILVILMTFHRLRPFNTLLKQLVALPYIERIIGVWNDVNNPPTGIQFPESNGKFVVSKT